MEELEKMSLVELRLYGRKLGMKNATTFKNGLVNYFGEMHNKGVLKQDHAETLAMMFLSLNFGFVFFKASFGERLTAMSEEAYITGMVSAFVKGING